MEVFLVPVAADRYELYCEVPDEDPSGAAIDHDRGFLRGLFLKFSAMLADIERERYADPPGEPVRGAFARLKAWSRRLVAEAIAEQRLLWHLRRQTAVTATHPSDLDGAGAMTIVRATLRSDFEKHRRWLVVNVVLFLLSALLVLLPGPNIVGYYFAFRLVGHFFSMRGARQGLDTVVWRTAPSEPLTDLRTLAAEDCAARRPRVEQVAVALQLEHLARFFDRVALPRA